MSDKSVSVNNQMPLKCTVVNGQIQIIIGVETLAFAAANHPAFWDGVSGADVENIKVNNANQFANEVALYMNEEDEDGSTLITRMLYEAIANAVDAGCDGVEYDD